MDWQDRFEAREKAPKDLVTEADLAAQEAIRGVLLKAFPDHDFLGEEEAAERKAMGKPIPPRRSKYRWVVDPLDGTANYVHGMPNFAVAIALQEGDDLRLGCVLDPSNDECFVAEAGKGATRNGQPIKVSGVKSMPRAMVAVSFSANVPRGSIEITRFVEVLHASQAVRRMGSAALNLCYVASGRLDAYLATSVSAWDVAAGALIVREAGGVVTGLDGSPLDLELPELVAASTPELHREALTVLAEATRKHDQRGVSSV